MKSFDTTHTFLAPDVNRLLFTTPEPAGRRITAGFTYLQRINSSAAADVWFPDAVHGLVDELLAGGKIPGPQHFPAHWAAVRQFELLQEIGNYKICNFDVEYMERSLSEITYNMRGGGYRITVAALGSYTKSDAFDELEIFDRKLQSRISQFINMLYLEEQSEKINSRLARNLRRKEWDYQKALPHIGVMFGARDIFRPAAASELSEKDRRHNRSRCFFEILSQLPQKHIVHETAIGLQLPESINEQEWIYVAPEGISTLNMGQFMEDIFGRFNKVSMSELDGRADAAPEIKAAMTHRRGYGDRLNPGSDNFLLNLLNDYSVH